MELGILMREREGRLGIPKFERRVLRGGEFLWILELGGDEIGFFCTRVGFLFGDWLVGLWRSISKRRRCGGDSGARYRKLLFQNVDGGIICFSKHDSLCFRTHFLLSGSRSGELSSTWPGRDLVFRRPFLLFIRCWILISRCGPGFCRLVHVHVTYFSIIHPHLSTSITNTQIIEITKNSQNTQSHHGAFRSTRLGFANYCRRDCHHTRTLQS